MGQQSYTPAVWSTATATTSHPKKQNASIHVSNIQDPPNYILRYRRMAMSEEPTPRTTPMTKRMRRNSKKFPVK